MADRSTAAIGLALAVSAVTLVGCGSSNAPTPSVASSTTAAAETQFVARAGAVCTQAGEHSRPLKAREEALHGEPTSEAAPVYVSLVRQAATIAKAAETQLRALPRPPGQTEQIAALVRAYAVEVGDAEGLAGAAAKRESSRGEAFSEGLERVIREHLTAAKRFGMGRCFTLE
jgi:hypothetical protein